MLNKRLKNFWKEITWKEDGVSQKTLKNSGEVEQQLSTCEAHLCSSTCEVYMWIKRFLALYECLRPEVSGEQTRCVQQHTSINSYS